MTTVQAYAVTAPNGKLQPFEYELGELGDQAVDIQVEHCGICHSDLSMVDNDWGMSDYPLVPGHEVIGTVAAVGNQVTHVQVGDRVGLGWHAGYCMACAQCMSGDHNMCSDATPTIVGHHGGFADVVRAEAPSVIKLPANLAPKTAGPLLCGGITVFNPFVQFDVAPTARVGVIGIGGLGHLALKFANAWGCHVTAFTSSESKRQEALEMGAHDVINSRNPDAIAAAAGQFDFILSTVNVSLDWGAYISALKPRGHFHFVGAVLEPVNLNVFSLLTGQRTVGASPVGSPVTIAQMLEFAAQHDIAPTTEHFPMSQVNEALDHLRSGKARYRIILDRD